jgi:hypothetical protein
MKAFTKVAKQFFANIKKILIAAAFGNRFVAISSFRKTLS